MLELAGLTKRYGEVIALDGLSMTVGEGRIHGFVGRNGAGKTTAMRIVLGLVRADGGTVRWQGRPVESRDRARFGYMPEERGLYPAMGVREQVTLFGRLSGMPATEARESATEILESLGLGERMDDKADALSLGNQQRAQLAVALVPQPELLVLDEPFSGLDPVGTDVLAELLRRQVQRGAAVLFSSHQLDLVESFCTEVTIIDRGRVVTTGGVADVRSRHGEERLRVGLHGGDTSWAEGIAGTELVRVDHGTAVLALTDGVDDQEILDRARRAGKVREFTRIRPTLTELFRDVVRA